MGGERQQTSHITAEIADVRPTEGVHPACVPLQFLEASRDQPLQCLEFYPFDFILRFENLYKPPRLSSDSL